MPFPSIIKGIYGLGDTVLGVKWNFKGGQLSWILPYDVAIFQKNEISMKFSVKSKIYQKIKIGFAAF